MSQKFVMLFLVSKTKIVTLDIAAKILIEESQDTADHSKFKSKTYSQMVYYYPVVEESIPKQSYALLN